MKKSKKKNYKKFNKITRKKSKLRGGAGQKGQIGQKGKKTPSSKKTPSGETVTPDTPELSKKQKKYLANQRLNVVPAAPPLHVTPAGVFAGTIQDKMRELKDSRMGREIKEMFSSHAKTIDTMFPAIHKASASEAGLEYPLEIFSSKELFDLIKANAIAEAEAEAAAENIQDISQRDAALSSLATEQTSINFKEVFPTNTAIAVAMLSLSKRRKFN